MSSISDLSSINDVSNEFRDNETPLIEFPRSMPAIGITYWGSQGTGTGLTTIPKAKRETAVTLISKDNKIPPNMPGKWYDTLWVLSCAVIVTIRKMYATTIYQC
mmetsp:Transcript_25839/g.29555  ORF Transcript_25839/g.29555 Transcript_25839/m.29555 type:complete len:104 (-) Transcript_25839:279-590(-)